MRQGLDVPLVRPGVQLNEIPDWADRAVRASLVVEAARTESRLREHLESHSVLEWLYEIRRLQRERAVILTSLSAAATSAHFEEGETCT